MVRQTPFEIDPVHGVAERPRLLHPEFKRPPGNLDDERCFQRRDTGARRQTANERKLSEEAALLKRGKVAAFRSEENADTTADEDVEGISETILDDDPRSGDELPQGAFRPTLEGGRTQPF